MPIRKDCLRILVMGLFVFFMTVNSNVTNAANRHVSDRELFRAIQGNNLELLQGYLAGDVNWHAIDPHPRSDRSRNDRVAGT
jgi:hypothetical protein